MLRAETMTKPAYQAVASHPVATLGEQVWLDASEVGLRFAGKDTRQSGATPAEELLPIKRRISLKNSVFKT